MTQKWIGAFGKDMQRGCMYRFLAIAVVVPLFCLFIILPLYMANRPGVSSDEALLVMAIPAALFIVLLFGGSALTLFISIRRRAIWLDEAFSTFHLEGSSYALTGRQYHGNYHGREMNVSFLRGPSLLIHLSTSLMTRMTVSDSMAVIQGLADLVNKDPVKLEEDQLIAYPHDSNWAHAYLSDARVRRCLMDLIFEEHPFLIRQVEFQPGTVTLRLYRSSKLFDFNVPADQTQKWIATMLELIELAEGQPAPAEALEPSTLAANVRAGKSVKYAWIIVGVIAVISVCVGIISLGIVFLVQ